MADIFLSYAHHDQASADALRSALTAEGYSVWSDREILPGMDFQSQTQQALESARAVFVLWSQGSIHSNWVLQEATLARRRGNLIPVRLDDSNAPLGFQDIVTGDLRDWNGDRTAEEFRKLTKALEYLRENAPPVAVDGRRLKEEQRRAQQQAADLFRQNLASRIVIERVELTQTLFYADLGLSLRPNVNVLLGRNGYGKSHLLRAILALLQHADDHAFRIIGNGTGLVSLTRDDRDQAIQFENEFFQDDDAVGKIPILAIPDARFVNRAVTSLGPPAEEVDVPDSSDVARNGAWHFLNERPFENVINRFLYALCLDYFQFDRSFDLEVFQLLQTVVRELTDRSFKFDRVERERDRVTLFVRTEGNENTPLPIQKASQGTLSVLVIMGLIYDYLNALRQRGSKVTERQGIVLIDELDAHLHPTWQQKMVALLRRTFPNVQFVITGHSPLLVAGCLEEEVSVLRRTGSERTFSVYQFPNDFVGWPADEIYRRVFEVEDADETYTRFAALLPFKKTIEKEVEAISSLSAPAPNDLEKRDQLEEQLHYMAAVEDRRSQRMESSQLKQENETLRTQLTVKDVQAQSYDDVRDELVGSLRAVDKLRARLRRAHMLLFVAALIALILALMTIWAART